VLTLDGDPPSELAPDDVVEFDDARVRAMNVPPLEEKLLLRR
jgi:hypothetical protein